MAIGQIFIPIAILQFYDFPIEFYLYFCYYIFIYK